MTPDPHIASIAKGLTKAGRKAIARLGEAWITGYDLPRCVLDHLSYLRRLELVERGFGDRHDPQVDVSEVHITTRISPSWYYRLSTDGLAVRTYLQEQDNG